MKDVLSLSTAKLQRIITIKKQIDRLQARLVKLAGDSVPAPAAAAAAPRKRRKMSAEARKRISAAATARWAKIRAAKKK